MICFIQDFLIKLVNICTIIYVYVSLPTERNALRLLGLCNQSSERLRYYPYWEQSGSVTVTQFRLFHSRVLLNGDDRSGDNLSRKTLKPT